jgi:hypothetical protein
MITAQEAKSITDSFTTSEHLELIFSEIKKRATNGFDCCQISFINDKEKEVLKEQGFKVNGTVVSWSKVK